MNKVVAIILSFFIFVNSSFALSNADIPNEFKVTQHWLSLTTSFNIETKTKRLGTLYRKFFSLLLTYDFYDPLNNKLATARAKFFSFNAHFDIYDNEENYLGFAEEKLFTFFPTFDIYAPDSSTKLARAKMNFWGIRFTIYDAATDKEIAAMHRSFFRLKNDWTISITNRALFNDRNIDPRVLMTVIAFQSDKEAWEQQYKKQQNTKDRNINKYPLLASAQKISKSSDKNTDVNKQQINSWIRKIDAMSQQEGLAELKNPQENSLEHIATELENNYNKSIDHDNSDISTQEKISDFTDYCLNFTQP